MVSITSSQTRPETLLTASCLFLDLRIVRRVAFVIQVPLLVLAMVLVYVNLHIPIPPSPDGKVHSARERLARIDYLGSLTLVVYIGSLLLGMSLKTSGELPWTDPWVWGLLVTSAVAGAAFLWVEAFFAAEPIVPLGLLKQVSRASKDATHALANLWFLDRKSVV